MQVPNFIRQIPDQLSNASMYIIERGAEVKQRINQYWETKRTEFAQSNFWKESGKPFYQRNIEPLNTTDYKLIIGSFGSAILLTAIAVKLYTIAILPLAASIGTLLFAGACHFSMYRVCKHFDYIAWNHVDQIRTAALSISPANPNPLEIAVARSALDQPEFSHLKDDLKGLDEKIKEFKELVIKHKDDQSLLKKDKQNLNVSLEAFLKKLAAHRPINKLDVLEGEEEIVKDEEKK